MSRLHCLDWFDFILFYFIFDCVAGRALWFVLEIIMAKNENNSHAFIRKMVENMKQTKDAQAPTDPKTNEVRRLLISARWSRSVCRCWVLCGEQKLYTVCDVAMHIIMSKSTTYSLESPKDPVLPSRYFTKPDKVGLPCGRSLGTRPETVLLIPDL